MKRAQDFLRHKEEGMPYYNEPVMREPQQQSLTYMYPQSADRVIIVATLCLIGVGVLMVYSSTAILSMKKYGTSFHYLKNQILTAALGIVTMVTFAKINYMRMRRFAIPLLCLSFILLLLVFVPHIGISAGGARRWLRLWPSTFQPSELVKIAMVIFLSDYMAKRQEDMKTPVKGLIIPIAIMGIFQIVLLKQPDLGAIISLGLLTISLLFIGGVRLSHILGLLLLSVPILYKLMLSVPYRRRRIMAFLDPWQDPLGSGFQLVQSLLALGNGGLTGVGLGQSKEKLFFLPEPHTDFISSLIGEELGFIGISLVILLFIIIFIRGVRIASRLKEPFGAYLCFGLTLMIGIQGVVNFSVVSGLMPTKGLPLPFVSYGGSSLLINMMAVGLLLNLSKTIPREEWKPEVNKKRRRRVTRTDRASQFSLPFGNNSPTSIFSKGGHGGTL